MVLKISEVEQGGISTHASTIYRQLEQEKA